MNLTRSQVKEVLARLPREEKEQLQRLPVKEAMVLVEMHYYFPQAHRVEELPEEPDEAPALELGASQLSELPGETWEDIFR